MTLLFSSVPVGDLVEISEEVWTKKFVVVAEVLISVVVEAQLSVGFAVLAQ